MTRIISLIAVTLFAVVALSTSAVAKDFYVVPTSDAAHGDTLLKHSDRLIAKDNAGAASYGKYLDGTRIVVGSLSEALGNCKSGRGDVIHIPEGVVLTLGVSGSITVSKNDVKIIGDGTSPAKIIPGALFPATNDVIAITGDGVTLENLFFGGPTSVDSVEAAVDVTGAERVTIKDCKFNAVVDIDTAYSYDDLLTVGAGSHDLTIASCHFENITTVTSTTLDSMIDFQGITKHVMIKDNTMFGAVATAGIKDDAKISGLSLIGNMIAITGTQAAATPAGLTLNSNPSGISSNNRVGGRCTTIANNADYGSWMQQFDNFILDESTAQQATDIVPTKTTE